MKKSILKLSTIVILGICSCNNSGSTSNNADSTNTEQNKPSTSNIDMKNINFSGTEPFWNLKFEDNYAIYTSPEELDGVKVFYKKMAGDSNNHTLNDAIIKVSDIEFKIFGVMGNSSVEITIKKEICSNGMSAEDFPFKIILIKDKNVIFEGCGNKI